MLDKVWRNQSESGTTEPRSEVNAGYGKMEMSNVQKTDNLKSKKDLAVRKSKGSMSTTLFQRVAMLHSLP